MMDYTQAVLPSRSLMIRVSQRDWGADEEYRRSILAIVSETPVAGICVFQGELHATAAMIAEIRKASPLPLLVAADYEFGLAMRLDDGTSFPHAMALGRLDDLSRTYYVAQSIAREMRAIGVDWNFAPVADVNSNPDNPIINIRSFGERADHVARHVAAYVSGLQNNGIIATVKHFPGHGNTAVDSHLGIPSLSDSVAQLMAVEVVPFAFGIDEGVMSVMTGHLAVPALDPSGTPASLSEVVTTDLLRREMAFEGVIITDALDMKAITDKYAADEASWRALAAGADIALLPADFHLALDGLKQALDRGDVSLFQLQESQLRIQKLHDYLAARAEPPMFDIDDHRRLALDIATKAVSVEGKKDAAVLPVAADANVAAFAVVDQVDVDQGARFFHYLQQTIKGDCFFGFVGEDITAEEVGDFRLGTVAADVVIVAVFARARSHKGTVGLSPELQAHLQTITGGRKTVLVLCGNPYLGNCVDADVVVRTYSTSEASLAAGAAVVVGADLAGNSRLASGLAADSEI